MSNIRKQIIIKKIIKEKKDRLERTRNAFANNVSMVDTKGADKLVRSLFGKK
jgi:hypothetical protein